MYYARPHIPTLSRETCSAFKSCSLLKALAFAADKHRHQRRKDAEASPTSII